MAEIKSEKSGPPVPDPPARSKADGPGTLDSRQLVEILNAHAQAIGSAIGEAIGQKFAELKNELSAGKHDLRAGEDAWLARCTPGEREHLEKLDHELHTLEEALEGPQHHLESEDGSGQPTATGEAVWKLPQFKPVRRDGEKYDDA